jgi:hypothetical protein
LLSQGSLGEASRGFILRLLSFTSLILPSGPLAPSSHEVRCNPENRSTQCPDKGKGISEREIRCKSGTMMGVDDGFHKSPQRQTKTYRHRLARAPCQSPKHGQVGKCKIQAVVGNKRNQMHIFKGSNDQR